MVQLLHDGLVHVLLQVGDVHYHSGFGVHWTSYSDLDCMSFQLKPVNMQDDSINKQSYFV